jgi:GT2 family glycosyltransferase
MDYVIGAAMLVSQPCLDIRLLPDEYFLYFEDVDFCYGAKAAGVRIGVAPEAVVYHKDGKGSTRMEKEYYFARNLLHFVWKNMPWALPFSLWYLLIHRITVKLFAGQFRNIGHLLIGVGDFLRGRLGERA